MKRFSFDTVQDFDSHILQSIPGYRHIWELIGSISSYFIVKNGVVYDLGCSTGVGLQQLSDRNKIEGVKFIGYDVSDNLLNKIENTRTLLIQKQDITSENLSFPNACMVLMIFTLQFLPTSDKEKLLKRIYNSLLPGGALIICEKTVISSGKIQDIFTFSYYDFKQKNFSKDQILDKQYDLRSMMKNNTASEIVSMLANAGFSHINPFFQSLQFMGWVCIK